MIEEIGIIKFDILGVATISMIQEVVNDLRKNNCDLLTLGQYLQPDSDENVPVERYVNPIEFLKLSEYAKSIGFKNVASGPLVRSSYHADNLFDFV
jgi:lipoic acid synthetase